MGVKAEGVTANFTSFSVLTKRQSISRYFFFRLLEGHRKTIMFFFILLFGKMGTQKLFIVVSVHHLRKLVSAMK